jgi:integrase/recombinase XerD
MTHDPSRVRITGPLHPFAPAFVKWLTRQGYTRVAATFQLHFIAHLSRWLADERLDASRLSMTTLDRFLCVRREAGYTQWLSPKALEPLLAFLREQGVNVTPRAPAVNGPVEALLVRYREYVSGERGLRDTTARGYMDVVRPFVGSRLRSDGRLTWDSLTAADVIAFVVASTPKHSRGTAALTVTALRSLLRWLYVEGVIAQPLADVVPSVARWRLAGLPKALTPADVKGLLGACDRRTRTGRRDSAILLALLRLGLRAGEVAQLQLDDVDWRAGTLMIRGKGPQIEPVPLPADVGRAIASYLRRGRPTTATDRTLFVRRRAPHRRLSSTGVTQIVFAAAARAGLGPIYAHRLRHTAATQLLRAGAALAEIGQLLRHRRALTTAIYAKVDRAALRTIARPWPGAAR